ncbi:MAG: saccharopine dehydrogenase NADP-binding domain-containing protein [Hyphomonadaceae bacterium]|nr:saccharopine dehydrogenase NADP-binding domain-containing protein [Hyphomonadaceae bacterium]
MAQAREFDVIVYGATGFTGRLVAEYLAKAYRDTNVAWAMAGRSETKLAAIRDEIGAPASIPLIKANADDPASLAAMARRTKVVLTTVGPYQLYGEPLLAACVQEGTDYVDLCGEPSWMVAMIPKYQDTAKASGARIVFSCGFDSIPFDGGVFFLQSQAKQRFGAPLPRVRGRVRKMKGTFSGGTAASMMATIESGAKDPNLMKVMRDPYALTPNPPATRQPSGERVVHEEDLGQYSAPFIMATINTKNVHRTNALLGGAYGADFTYDEMQLFGAGPKGKSRAKAAANGLVMQMVLLAIPPTRALLRWFVLPKPGEGPNKHARETGSYDVLFVGQAPDGRTLRASVSGDMDPGYGSTSKMITEAALCMAQDIDRTRTPGGVWTPMAAMGETLIARLQAKAGLKFVVEA